MSVDYGITVIFVKVAVFKELESPEATDKPTYVLVAIVNVQVYTYVQLVPFTD